MFGEEEQEKYFVFNKDNTNKLFELFKTKDLLTSLYNYFDGKLRDWEFFDYCKENGIVYKEILC